MSAARKTPKPKYRATKLKRARKPARVTGAVIFLASLLWEDDREADEPLGKSRMEWRKKHLVMDRVADLRVPIRYWRKSGTDGRRRGQYTMVFAGKELGVAKFAKLRADLPVRAGVVLAKTKTQIAREADALARAEDIQKKGDTGHVCTWGVVAMGINPKSPHRAELRRVWRDVFKGDPKVEHWKFGTGVVDRSGFLRVRLQWSDGTLRGVDFCLATQTDPAAQSPSPQMIADAAWPIGSNSYFYRTVAAGIVTVDDEAIHAGLAEARARKALPTG